MVKINYVIFTLVLTSFSVYGDTPPPNKIPTSIDAYRQESNNLIKDEILYKKMIYAYLDKGCPVDHYSSKSDKLIDKECADLLLQIKDFSAQLRIRSSNNERLLSELTTVVTNAHV